MHHHVEDYMIKCHQSQVNKAQYLKDASLLHPLDIPNNKWKCISVDSIVGLLDTQKGHDAIWVLFID